MTQSVLEVTAAAAVRHQNLSARLLRDTNRRAAETARRKEAERQKKVQEKLTSRRLRTNRMHVALQGVAGLCAFGLSPQFQSLIRARGKPLVVWGGEHATSPGFDMMDVWWKWVSYTELTATELRIINHTETSGNYGSTYRIDHEDFRLELPYGDCAAYLRARPLWNIATATALDLDDPPPADEVNDLYSTDRLFEVLVACGDSRKFGKLIRMALESDEPRIGTLDGRCREPAPRGGYSGDGTDDEFI